MGEGRIGGGPWSLGGKGRKRANVGLSTMVKFLLHRGRTRFTSKSFSEEENGTKEQRKNRKTRILKTLGS